MGTSKKKKTNKKLAGINLHTALKKVRFVVFDFDGVMTDNRVWVNQDGVESVACNRSDGLGVSMLRKLNTVEMQIVSTESNPVVHRRAEKLKISCEAPCDDKLTYLSGLLKQKNVSWAETAFVGNDVNDLQCLEKVGVAVVVRDAYPEVKKVAHLILSNNGGHGAVREFCDLVRQAHSEKGSVR